MACATISFTTMCAKVISRAKLLPAQRYMLNISAREMKTKIKLFPYRVFVRYEFAQCTAGTCYAASSNVVIIFRGKK